MPVPGKVVLYIATSIDGYIAKPGDDLGFLSIVQKPGEDYGYQDFLSTIDTVILGRRTYEWVMTHVPEFPHNGKSTWVISGKQYPDTDRIKFYSGDLKALIFTLKSKEGKNIFIDGGSMVVNSLLKEKLIDEFFISVIPVLLGDGIRLFNTGFPEQRLTLISTKQYDTGLVQLHYTGPDS